MIATDAPATRNPRALQRVFARMLAAAAIVGVAMLGNLRLQASEAVKADPRTSLPRLPVRWIGDSAPDGRAAVMKIDPAAPALAEPNVADQHPDNVQLVPAIYAWNPDVRFVYFRHVSKWM